jgi:hypothetical protein
MPTIEPANLRVVIAYKNFAMHAAQGVSHIGLGVSALNNVKVLQKAGIRAEVLPLKYDTDLRKFLNLQAASNDQPVTHVIVSAPWIRSQMYQYLCATFPLVQFAMNCHSNVGFLQADTNGIRLIREGLALESGTHNFRVCGNSKKFCRFIYHGYGSPCGYLPNMYFFDGSTNPQRPSWPHTRGTLRLGAFGATRTLKNFLTACAAGLCISRDLKAQTEIWLNTGREDGAESKRIIRAAHMMLDGLPNVSLNYLGWRPWPDFRKAVGNMHLLIAASFTESFSVVTADGIAEGIPSVVSPAIDWAPREWTANPDDVFDISRIGMALINDPLAATTGYRALKNHNRDSLQAWFRFLGLTRYNAHASVAHEITDAGDIASY